MKTALDVDLSGKLALVTGASRGIGAAIAKQLAAQGAQVLGTATSEAGAESITEALSQYTSPNTKPSTGLVLNVQDTTGINAMLEALQAEHGSPDILINNAGITQDNLMLRMQPEEWESVLNINLHPVFYLVKALLKGMSKKRWGRIINISSVVASTGNPGQVNYSAAKAGLEGFIRSLAREMGKRGITANVVAPGYIETDMTAALNEDQKKSIMSSIPAGYIGSAQDIAQSVGFLASPAANYINGQVIHVNGGMFMS